MAKITITNQTEPDTPASGKTALYVDSVTKTVMSKDDAGALTSYLASVTAGSNVGTAGVGIFKQLSGSTLQFKKINAGSNKVSITDDTADNEVDIDLNEANIDHDSLSGAGSYTHAQIDAHIDGHTHVAADVTDFTAAAKSATVADALNNGTTDVAPSQNAVFDALALKANANAVVSSLAKSGSAALTGAVTLSQGSNVTLTQVGNDIEISSSGGGATPGGSDTHVQYNDGGALGGESTFAYNKTTNTLTVENLALTNALPVAQGGTGSTTAANARTALGLVIGTNVQAQDAELSALAGVTSAANKVPYFTGSGTATVADFTAAGRALVDDADASAQRTTLGLGTVATFDVGSIHTNGLIDHGFEYWTIPGPSAVTAMTDAAYSGPDVWYTLIQGAGATITRTGGFNKSLYAARLVAGTTTNRFGIAQIIEGREARQYRGETVSFQAVVLPALNAGSGTMNVRAAILEWTGAQDSVTKEIVNNWASSTFTTGNFFTSTTLAVVGTATFAATHGAPSMISVSGTVSTSANNLIVFVWHEDVPAHAADLIDIAELGFYLGSTSRSWRMDPRGLYDARVRFMIRGTHGRTSAAGTGGGAGPINIRLNGIASAAHIVRHTYSYPEMRGTPTVTVYDATSGTAGQVRDVTNGTGVTATVIGATYTGVTVEMTQSAASTDSHFAYHLVMDARL